MLRTQYARNGVGRKRVAVHEFDEAMVALTEARKQMREAYLRMAQHTAVEGAEGAPPQDLLGLNGEFLGLARAYREVEARATKLRNGPGSIGKASLDAAARAAEDAWLELCAVWAPLAGWLVERLTTVESVA